METKFNQKSTVTNFKSNLPLSTQYISWVLILLACIIINNYIDRSSIAYAITAIKSEFTLTDSQFGLLTTTFAIGYLIMTFLGGILVDRYGPKKIITIFGLSWSLTILLMGFCKSYSMLLLFRFLLGLTEGPCFPCITRVVADNFPITFRARFMTFALIALPLASMLGAPTLALLIHHYEWRITFILLGVASAIPALVWFFLYREVASSSKENALFKWSEIKTILRNRDLMLNNFADFAYGYTLFFALIWLPVYLEKAHHLKLKTLGWIASIPWLATIVMAICVAILSDYLWRRYQSLRLARSCIIWMGLLLSSCGFIIVVLSQSLWMCIVGLSLGIGFCVATNSAFFALNMDLAPEYAGTSMGIMNVFFASSGMISPWLTGKLIDATGNFNSAILLLVTINLLAVIAVALFQRPTLTFVKLLDSETAR
jgi:MFS family permease